MRAIVARYCGREGAIEGAVAPLVLEGGWMVGLGAVGKGERGVGGAKALGPYGDHREVIRERVYARPLHNKASGRLGCHRLSVRRCVQLDCELAVRGKDVHSFSGDHAPVVR